jgi:predicted glycosyl hydrolase (DUF1957 family)
MLADKIRKSVHLGGYTSSAGWLDYFEKRQSLGWTPLLASAATHLVLDFLGDRIMTPRIIAMEETVDTAFTYRFLRHCETDPRYIAKPIASFLKSRQQQ